MENAEQNFNVLTESLLELLWSRRLSSGLWSWTGIGQAATEPSCFAYLALRSDPHYAQHLDPDALLKMQLADSSWSVIPGDTESSWATALAVSALGFSERGAEARSRAIDCLLQTRGKEAHWFWNGSLNGLNPPRRSIGSDLDGRGSRVLPVE